MDEEQGKVLPEHGLQHILGKEGVTSGHDLSNFMEDLSKFMEEQSK